MSLSQEFAHLQIPLAEIKSATDNFADENIIGKGSFGNVYKGQLQLFPSGELINIAAKRLDRKYGQKDKQFWTEIVMLSSVNHENLVSNIGYCDEDGEKIIINKYEVNRSLDIYLSDPITLTWLQRLHICVGAARLLSYIHYDVGRRYNIIHRNIKSSKILLDEKWEAKVCGLGHSVQKLATRRNHLDFDTHVGTVGYVDPVYRETGSMTQKSDVYSFGVMLFEVLCGRKAFMRGQNKDRYLFATAKQHYEEEKLDEIILPNLRNQMHQQSFIIVSETAYHCLQKQRMQRPDMEKVAKNLEKAWKLQWKHENPDHLKTQVDRTSFNHLQERNLEHLKIRLADIKLATDNFAKTYYIGSGGYAMVYKAQLDYFDSESPLKIKRKNTKDELPRKRGTVAIKRMFSRGDDQGEQSFFYEIEMLTRCKHPNVISLLGICDEAPERILVYEYVNNGSLDDYLGNTDKMTIFRWVERIKICLDIANGLNYLHSTVGEKQMIIHRDMKSANVLLGKNWEAKIADFGLSRSQHANQQRSTLNTSTIAGTEMYLDPEYAKTGKLKKESDIYSFGVVLFEILSGKLAYDESYNVGHDKGLPSTVRRYFNEGILKEIVDPRILEEEETYSNNFTNTGPDQYSLDAFLKIAYHCLDETRARRPTIEAVIKELEEVLYFQENRTRSFQKLYKVDDEFLKIFNMLMEYEKENDEMDYRILLYEYAPKRLDRNLDNSYLKWIERLKICIDVGSELELFHGGGVTQEVVIHGDIKSSNILLTWDWKAEISDYDLTLISPINAQMNYVIDSVSGSYGYVDPVYMKTGFLTKESDIYSFGLVLLEILSGRLISEKIDGHFQNLTPEFKRHYEEGTFDEMVFAGIKEQIVPNSLTTFVRIAYQCLRDKREERPNAREVVVQLKIALDFQRDYELWEPKFPKDYKEIIQMSDSSQVYSTEKKEDLYNMFSNGILLQQGKLLLSFEGHGERNELISATKFSYRNRSPHKWRSLTESRFHKVAEMLDISNLMIRIKTKTQFLSPNVVYGVYLVFKFCDSSDFPSKPMHVDLSYRKGNETLHAYFATRRDNEWMMIELYRFLNQKKDEVFKFLIESLSPYYCRDNAIYVEGIEFRAIKKVEREEFKRVKEVLQVLYSNLNVDLVQQILSGESEKLFSLSKVNQKKHLMLSAKAALNNFSDLKLYKSKPSAESRFQEVIELLPQRAFRINCKIKSQILSPDTEYACYLVFNLSEECQGMHCPVEVRDLLNREKKEYEIIYFVSPNPWNILDITRVPEQRKDGWMEVIVWKFNSNQEVKNGCIAMDLNLISYEGTLSGLVVCGLEFRPM